MIYIFGDKLENVKEVCVELVMEKIYFRNLILELCNQSYDSGYRKGVRNVVEQC